jgi:GNAT superfamily N-acetyltransferase
MDPNKSEGEGKEIKQITVESGRTAELFDMYKTSELGTLWPIDSEKFEQILFGTNDTNNETEVFIEEDENNIQGVIALKYKKGDPDSAVIIFEQVKPEEQNKGIGTRLLQKVFERAEEIGNKSIAFGGKVGSYFWPGIPENLHCNDFFSKQGFEVKDGPVDMHQEITNWFADKKIFDRIEEQGISIRFASELDSDSILQFEKENFPNWYDSYYKRLITREQYEKVFFAEKDGKILAVSELWDDGCNWDMLFKGKVGGGGALGVSEKYQGLGIGLAMKAWGTQKLKERGIQNVWIGWTYAVGLYEKLGFKVWRKFSKATKKL